MWSSSAPAGRPVAYWNGASVGAIRGVSTAATAVVAIRRSAVPQAMGRILPLGLRSGMSCADAMAFMTGAGASPVQRSKMADASVSQAGVDVEVRA